MSRAHRLRQLRSDLYDHRSCGFGGKTVGRFEPDYAAAHGADDAPAAGICAKTYGKSGNHRNPERHRKLAQMVGADQRQGDHGHGLLRIIGAVTERDECGREYLQAAKVSIDRTRVGASKQIGQDNHYNVGNYQPDNRRGDERNHNRQELAPLDRMDAVAGDAHAHKPTDQCMRRAGRQAGAPGNEVPDDRPDQACDYVLERNSGLDRDYPRNRIGHLGVEQLRGHQRPNQVQGGGKQNREPRRERPGPDGRSNSVGGVMKAVREVEAESYQDCSDEQQRSRVRHS